MGELHETEIDGVRCFWVETGRPTLAARLMFRQGQADEDLTESGWQHLLEHLALQGRGSGTLHVNGSTSLLETTLDVHGPDDAVASALAAATSWLANPQFDDLERERNVLRAEGGVRGDGPVSRAIVQRYGALGPGTVQYGEPGLGAATPERLAARVRRVFTTGNGVLLLDGPPPADLRIHLQEGDRLPFVPVTTVETTIPARYIEEGGLVLSGVVYRNPAMSMAAMLLRDAIVDRWRTQDGTAYAPWSSYERLDADHALLVGGTDVLPEALPTLAEDAIHFLHRLASNVPDDSVLTDRKAATVQALADPYNAFAVAMRAGSDYLQGRPALRAEQILDEVRSVTGEQVRSGFAAMYHSLLIGLPSGATWAGRWPTLQMERRVARDFTGARHRSANWPADTAQLVIGDETVEVRNRGYATVVQLDRLAGMMSWSDGRRYLLQRDGYGLLVNASAWRDGEDAVLRLDQNVPTRLQLSMTGTTDPVRRLSFRRRWWPLVRRHYGGVAGIVVILIVLGAAIAAILFVPSSSKPGSTRAFPSAGSLGLITIILLVRLVFVRRRRGK